jgi:YD repeat-containing protein
MPNRQQRRRHLLEKNRQAKQATFMRQLRMEPLEPRLLLSNLEFRLSPDDDTGTSNSDAITSERNPRFDVTLDDAGELQVWQGDLQLFSEWLDSGTSQIMLEHSLFDGRHEMQVEFYGDGDATQLDYVVVVDTKGPWITDPVARPALDGLIAFYDFEGHLQDRSGHGYDGTTSQPAFVNAGFEGQGFHFDGDDDYVDLPLNINASVYPQLTMGAWVRTESDVEEQAILSHEQLNYQRQLLLYPDGETANWSAFAGDHQIFTTDASPQVGDWTFVAAAYDQTAETVTLYVDDEVFVGDAVMSEPFGLEHVIIGQNASFSGDGLIGTVDNVFFFDSTLTPDQIAFIRQQGSRGIAPQPADRALAFYDFENGAEDLSGHGFDGTVDGAVATGTEFRDTAYYFDGTSHIELPFETETLQHPNLTIGAWVKADSGGDYQTILSAGHDSGLWSLETEYDDEAEQAVWAAGTIHDSVRTDQPVLADEWTFLAAVYDMSANSVAVYVNDTVTESPLWLEDNSVYSEESWAFGVGAEYHGDWDRHFSGMIDELFVIDAALDAESIASIRDLGLAESLLPRDFITAEFQQNQDDYFGTLDTWLDEGERWATYHVDPTMFVTGPEQAESQTEDHALLRFEQIFGYFPGQVPPEDGYRIESATLELYTADPGSGAALHRMVTPWGDFSSWDSLGEGIQADDLEAAAIPDLITGYASEGAIRLDVTDAVRDWFQDPDSNFGWALLPIGTDSWEFFSAEGAVPPKLSVTYSRSAEMPVQPSPYDRQSFSFNEAVVLGSFLQATDVVGIWRHGEEVPPQNIVGSGATWQVELDGPQPSAIYDYAIYSVAGDLVTFRDLAGNSLDQDRDGHGSQWWDDYRFAVEVGAPAVGNQLWLSLSEPDDTGSSNTDQITNLTQPRLLVSLDADGVLEIDFDDDGEFDFSEWRAAGDHLVPTSPLSEGSHQISATLTADSGPVSQDHVNITVDTTAPEIESIDGETFNVQLSPAALSIGFVEALAIDTDSVTDSGNYVIRSSGGDGVFDNGNDLDVSDQIESISFSTTDEGGVAELTLTPSLPGEIYQITVLGTTSVRDIAGNRLGGGSDFVIEQQLSVDGELLIELASESDTGISDTDHITRNNQPSFDIEITVAGTLHLYTAEGDIDITEVYATGGSHTLSLDSALSDGERTIEADFTPPGQATISASLPLTIDTSAPELVLNADRYSLEFDGSNDYVGTPVVIDQSHNSVGVTFEFWAFPHTTSGTHAAISSDNGGYDWAVETNGSTWQLFTGSNRWNTGVAVDANQWQHVTVVYKPHSGIEFYKNDQKVTTSTIGYDSNSLPLTIGRSPGYSSYFDGLIDEVRVWNRSLSEAEVLANIYDTVPPVTESLAGYWRLDTGSGLVARDLSGNGNHGSLGAGNSDRVPLWSEEAAPLQSEESNLIVPVSRRLIQFSEPIVPDSFDISDVSFPAATNLALLGEGQYYGLTFDPLEVPGIYDVLVGPDIVDLAGNVMDYDGNGAGGEATDAWPWSFELQPDTTPPEIVEVSVGPNGYTTDHYAWGVSGAEVTTITLHLSEPLDSNSVDEDKFALVDLGADGQIGGDDDTAHAIQSLSVTDNQVVIDFGEPLEYGRYELTVASGAVTDRFDNLLVDAFPLEISSYDVDPSTFIWLSDADGTWQTASRWNRGRVPGSNDSVLIDRIGYDPRISIVGNANVGDLRSEEAILIDRETFTIHGEAVLNGSFTSYATSVFGKRQLTVTGVDASLLANGPTNLDGAIISATSGGKIYFPTVTTHSMLGPLGWPSVSANGAGSLIDMSNVTTFNGHTFINFSSAINALNGGRVDLSACTQMPKGILQVTADGANSVVDFSSLEMFRRNVGGDSFIKAVNGGSIPLGSNTVAITNTNVSIGGDGSITAGTIELLGSSTLSGNGVLGASVVNSHEVVVGGSPGGLTIDGDYMQTSGASLRVQVGGVTPVTDHDQLIVTGHAELSGTLALSLINDYEPELDDVFRIIEFDSGAGRFDDVTGIALPNDLGFYPEYHNQDVSLKVILHSGPAVVEISPVGTVTETPTALEVQFDLPIDPDSFTPDDIQLEQSGTTITVGTPIPLGGNLWRVPLPELTEPGDYSVAIGPEITDLVGNQMDQDKDKANGELDDDVFRSDFRIEVANLVANDVSTDVTSASFGQSIQFEWNATNLGNVATSGVWQDALWLSADPVFSVDDDILMSQVSVTMPAVAPSESYQMVADIDLPLLQQLDEGDYYVLLQVNSANQLKELTGSDNVTALESPLSISYPALPDIVPRNLTVTPEAPLSGQEVLVSWSIENDGEAAVNLPFHEQITLFNDTLDTLVGEFTFTVDPAVDGPLVAGESRNRQVSITLPDGEAGTGDITLTLNSDADQQIFERHNEHDAEGNNTTSTTITATATPYPDLTVSDITAPHEVIGDPGEISVSWTVINAGDGPGRADHWSDAVVVSRNEILGDGDDVLLKQFEHNGLLQVDESYARSETFQLPPGFSGRFHLFAVADFRDDVFENHQDDNNAREASQLLDVMPRLYADLEVSSVEVPTTIYSGADFSVSWTVTNSGRAITDTPEWVDQVYLATDAAGTDRVANLGKFKHFGHLDVSDSYTRAGTLALENGLAGTFYLVVVTGGPYEFVYTDNNATVSTAMEVVVPPLADLQVADISAPVAAVEGERIDITWTVVNSGPSGANGSWTDKIYLRESGNPDASVVPLGEFRYTGSLATDATYTRREAVLLPAHISGLYDLIIATNTEQSIYEGVAANNNSRPAAEPLTVSIQPRPDLQISDVTVPENVDAGGTLAVSYVVTNQGTVPTTIPHWVDRVYLSLDNRLTRDDVLIDELPNQSALAPGEDYLATTQSLVVPKRYRGDMFVLFVADADEQMDEWPNEQNNLVAQPLYVTPAPLADLVVSDPLAPTQAVQGAEIEVGFTVTNRGPGATNVESWTDTIWLTQDKNRPHPGQGDVLLATIAHQGALEEDAGYDVEQVTVQLPDTLAAGTYYIMPWTDPYDVVLEDTLASNINPDDPNQIDNNNYKARAIDVLGALPDLVVTALEADAAVEAGTTIDVDWTVENQSLGHARPAGWVDYVYLSTDENPFADGAGRLLLGSVKHNETLAPDAAYSASLSVTLSPSAVGSHIVVITDSAGKDPTEDHGRLDELNELNNLLATSTQVTPAPADLQITDIQLPATSDSGEPIQIQYTVTNVGDHALWAGTEYWKDFLWISADAEFIRERASYLGEAVYAPTDPIAPGDSYNVTFETVLPTGLDGQYYVHIHLDAHNDITPLYFPMQARILRQGWWPAHTGSNADLLEQFRRWAYEDPSNNLASAEMTVTYREPDLWISDISVPSNVESGDTFAISYTVSNAGTRDTRQSSWRDGIYLSRDASLDNRDLSLGDYLHTGGLAVDDSYERSVSVTLPEGIQGDFYLLVYCDTPIKVDLTLDSDIGFGYHGLKFASDDPFWPWDLASHAARRASRGTVFEFQDEGNNIADIAVPIQLATPPDLQVTSVEVPERVYLGQSIDVTYEVSNLGGNIPTGQTRWNDLVYLSRDQFLDMSADRYLGLVEHTGDLLPNENYTVSETFDVPIDLIGPYYVFVITDPVRRSPIGSVFEHDAERNNSLASDQPVVIELPPPSDLEVTATIVPESGVVGNPIEVQWTVTNLSNELARGKWTDSVYLSQDTTWDIHDRFLGRLEHGDDLIAGDSYTSSLNAALPPVIPGQYRIIVRTDIYNQVYEDENELNNATTSADSIRVEVDALQLGSPLTTTLNTGQERLYQVTVPAFQTLRVTAQAGDNEAANELFVRFNAAPTGINYDAAYQGALSAQQTAIVPDTQPGVYYILVRGHSEPSDATPVTLLAELLPLSITNVATDTGGDSSYVTTRIEGAQFHPNALVKLVRPGIAEYEPILYEVVSSTEILATFDFTDAPHGLYDLKVVNPNGDEAIVAYRFMVERAIQPEVTIGIGGPRAILAGDIGTYSVALQNLSNLDAPYTYFEVGIPELGTNMFVYDLPYLTFTSNVHGRPTADELQDIAWASLDSAVNTTGQVNVPGVMYNEPADGFSGFTFNVQTYPGLKELYERAFDQLREQLYAAFPQYAEQGVLDDGPQGLDLIYPGLYDLYNALGGIPDDVTQEFIPFQFHVYAAATAMNRDEYVATMLEESHALRQGILQDPEASTALLTIAADMATWDQLFLASLEEAGLLLPADQVPPLQDHPSIVSLMTTLASGILIGPAGNEVRSSGDLQEFFGQVRAWYGHDPENMAEIEGVNPHANPIAALPPFADYDLGLSQPTYYEAFRVYVPWIPFDERGSGLPADFQINGVEPTEEEDFAALELSSYLEGEAGATGLASIVGPFTGETGGFLPADATLPYTVHFQNDPRSSEYVSEVRIVASLDDNLDPRSFRLGDLKVGEINVHIPSNRGLFQGEFDFVAAKGFVLRVSAGVDLATGEATWLLQAIDPITGEVLRDPTKGLLPPNTALGEGAGFISYTLEPVDDIETGTEINASARVLFNTAAPEDTQVLTQVVDGQSPATQLSVTRLGENTDNYRVEWTATDDPFGSGVRHVTLYVAEDGGDFQIWQRQVGEAAGVELYVGEAGHTYEFLALATDVAGNRETPPFGISAADDGSEPNLGTLPTVGDTTPPNFGVAPEPSEDPSTNPLFSEAELQIPAALPNIRIPEFTTVLHPFQARAFATGIAQSHADIGPMALVELADGSFLVSGGEARTELFHFSSEGGEAGDALIELDYPIFGLALASDGSLWATTGGGPLLQLDPATGEILHQYGDGLAIALAIAPDSNEIYVSSNQGIEVFHPETGAFTHFSRDDNLRVGSLAFDADGTLWATTWPDRRQIVKFNARGRAELMLQFSSDIDSLAFGQAGTPLDGLLFVSHNAGSDAAPGSTDARDSQLTMVDVATLRTLPVAQGGSRGDVLITTSDGRLLISQSLQVDLLGQIGGPAVLATNPPADGLVSLPLPIITVTFDQDMFVGNATQIGSVVNPNNYLLTGQQHGEQLIHNVVYDTGARTAILSLANLPADHYELTVVESVQNVEGLTLTRRYQTEFTAVTDFSGFIDVAFDRSRSDRSDDTVSYDVVVTNIGDTSLRLPVVLEIDPASGFDGLPADAAGQTSDGRWLIDLSASVLNSQQLAPGESTQGQTVTLLNPHQQQIDVGHSVSALPGVNEAPVFDSDPVTAAVVDQPYAYDANAHDPDDESLTYLLNRAPSGMSIDASTGLIEWLPTDTSSAATEVIVHVYDTRGGMAAQSYVITVAGGNHAPILGNVPSSIEGTEGQPLSVPLPVSDPDGDDLIFWAGQLPAGASLNPTTGLFTWTPDFASAGIHHVELFVTDGVHTVEPVLSLVIQPSDQPPEFPSITDRTLLEGDRIRIKLAATDQDGDELTFASPNLPAGATLDPATGWFDWVVQFHQAGQHEVEFQVLAGGQKVHQTVTFSVLNANAAPVFEQSDPWRVREGETIEFRVFAFDPDNPEFVPQDRLPDGSLTDLEGTPPSVTYVADSLPPGGEFDVDTGMFRWTPSYVQAGQYELVVSATDDGDGTGLPLTRQLTVPLQVLNLNRRPEITAIAAQTVQRDTVAQIPVSAIDPDGNALVLNATEVSPSGTLPPFITFTDHGDGTGLFSVAPGVGDRGDYSIILSATDDGDGGLPADILADSYTFVVTVDSANEPPLLEPMFDSVALVGEPLTIPIQVTDLDQDALQFELSGLPDAASLTFPGSYGTATLEWTPTLADIGSHVAQLTVTDSGNGDPLRAESDVLEFTIVVRETNVSPVLDAVGNLSATEGQPLTLQLAGTDPDGDSLTYSFTNLPAGVAFDPLTGQLDWTPTFDQEGVYDGVVFGVTDGLATDTEAVSITVANSNRAPQLVPQSLVYAREGQTLDFDLAAGDADGDSLFFQAISDLPAGANLNSQTGHFSWPIGFDQAGHYTFTFGVEDLHGAADQVDVLFQIDDVNRPPQLATSHHAATLGKELRFFVSAVDPDDNTTLSYAADFLPEGASLDANTGEFVWTPGPGQAGEYVVTFHVSDGQATSSESILLRASAVPSPPDVAIELTPSFPVVPGSPVLIHAIAGGLADIVDLQVQLDGQPLTLDETGRAEIVVGEPGKMQIEATATDADQLEGQAATVIKVLDPSDTTAPILQFGNDLGRSIIESPQDITATIQDQNLDWWKLEIADRHQGIYRLLAEGEIPVNDDAVATLDPDWMENGFYTLRLTARDMGGRETQIDLDLEVNSAEKNGQYATGIVDLSTTLGAQEVELLRQYNSLASSQSGSLGLGWSLFATDMRLETDVPVTGREALGVYQPFKAGTRLYVTLPNGTRAGYTFQPEEMQIPGLTYYRPSWLPDDGVDFALRSVDSQLMRAGSSYFDLATGQPYQPGNPAFTGVDYQLTAPNGTVYDIEVGTGVVAQQNAAGQRLYFGSNGIVAENGDAIRFTRDAQGRITRATAPDQSTVDYRYNANGQLIAVHSHSSNDTTWYGYSPTSDNQLTAIVDQNEQTFAVAYDPSPHTLPITDHLGRAIDVAQNTTNGSLAAAETDRYTLVLTDSELATVPTGQPLLRVSVTGTAGDLVPALPLLNGQRPIFWEQLDAQVTALFAIQDAGVHMLEVAASRSDAAGTYQLLASIAGDVNSDGQVDGSDSSLLTDAWGAVVGDSAYSTLADVDGSGEVDAADRQLLAANFGFLAVADSWPLVGGGEGEYSNRNALFPEDVDCNGFVSPRDALIIINHLNRSGISRVTPPNDGEGEPAFMLDVNGDQWIAPVDALLIINYLNAHIDSGDSDSSDPESDGPESEHASLPPSNDDQPSTFPENEPLGQSMNVGIANGDFSIDDLGSDDFGWLRRGSAYVLSGRAILDEGPSLQTEFRQSFVIPPGAEALQFTLLGIELASEPDQPPDAFEVALLANDTSASALSVPPELADTDALINIQANGQTFFGDSVLPPTPASSGQIFEFDSPSVFTVDLSQVAAGSEVTLYFDLLGFGSSDSQVMIDDVTLLGVEAPVAVDDLATTSEDTPVTIEVLPNDSVVALPLDSSSIIVTTAPQHGTVNVDDSTGNIVYTPFDDYAGDDQFSYRVSNSAGVASNEATVAIHIAAVADAPRLSVESAAGDQDTAIPLTISPRLRDIDGSEALTVEITDLPLGARLSTGTLTAPGVYQLAEHELVGLTVTPPTGSPDDFTITVTALAREASNNDQAAKTANLKVDVQYVFVEPLQVAEITTNDGAAQRSTLQQIAVRFTQDIWTEAAEQSVQIVQQTTSSDTESTVVPLAPERFAYDSSTYTLAVDLTGLIQQDAHYRLLLDTTGIRAATARNSQLNDTDVYPEDGIYTHEFHRLLGDFTGDDTVDSEDYDLLRNLLPSRLGDGIYDPVFDLDDDGRIDTRDYTVWRVSRMQRRINMHRSSERVCDSIRGAAVRTRSQITPPSPDLSVTRAD